MSDSRRSNHDVRRFENGQPVTTPCYCAATSQHEVGREDFDYTTDDLTPRHPDRQGRRGNPDEGAGA